jgi:hypothetical protein
MGYEVWVARAAAGDGGRPVLVVGPGRGATLLVCSEAADSVTKFAADLARALGGDPVWAWPDPAAAGHSLEEAVADGLFTRIVVFGRALAACLFGSEAPALLGTAAVACVPALDELADSGLAKRALWRQLRGPADSETGAPQ